MRTGRFKIKVGLALGGGAARGLAHVGVLRALERAKLVADIVTGTSMGAIIGGAYLAYGDVSTLESKVRELMTSEKFRKNGLRFLKENKEQRGGLFFSMANFIRKGVFLGVSSLRPSFISAQEVAWNLAAIVPDVEIQDLPRAFSAVAIDINSAKEVLLRKGGLRSAAAASSAIPGIMPPVTLDGRVLIDGGWIDKLPVLPAFKMGADVVIAVDISTEKESTKVYDKGLDIYVRANAIRDAILVEASRRIADVVIEPAVKEIHWADFTDFERCIDAGDEAASLVIPQIEKMLRRERWLSLIRAAKGKKLARMQLKSCGHDLFVE
jgi:NTE family protein